MSSRKTATSSSTKFSVEAARDRIRAAGLRATPARIAILRLLEKSDTPLTHAEVAGQTTTRGADVSTVFRALNEMAEGGLLHRMELGDHVWRYEVARSEEGKDHPLHPHFLCVDCGTITCLGEVEVDRVPKLSNAIGRVGELTEVLLKGHCKSCNES